MEQDDKNLEQLAGRKNPFAAPAGYFDTLSERIEAAVFADGLRSTAGPGDFSVPEGYFDTLGERITTRISTAPREMNYRRIGAWASYAAAACITVAIGAGLWFNRHDSFEDQLSDVPDQQIIRYLQDNAAPGDMVYVMETVGSTDGMTVDKPSDEAIEEYLDKTL